MERNENGTLKKGAILNPTGRPKGSTNKTTTELRDFISTLIDENREKIISDLAELEPKERIKTILEMMRFVLPTLKGVDGNLNITDGFKITGVVLSDDDDDDI